MGQARLGSVVMLVVGACCTARASGQPPSISRSAVTLQAPPAEANGGERPMATSADRLDAVVPVVAEGFEGTFPGQWTIRYGGTKAWWGTSTVRARTGARSAYCAAGGEPAAPAGGPYFAGMNTWLVRGPFSLADATAGRFTVPFWLKTQLEHDYFGYLVSIDGDQFHGNWWSGDTQGWRTESIDLAAVPNLGSVLGRAQVWIALVFQSDAATQLEGVYVDDVILEKPAPAPPCTLTCDGSSPATGSAGVGVQFTGQATATNCTGPIGYAWDFADGTVGSTQQSPTHVYAQAGTYPWRFTATVADTTCAEDGSITITNPQPCTLACTATVPASALVGAPVSVTATATPSNCTASPTYSWDWGDGTAFGTQPNPTHTYTRVGTFSWRMTASVGGKACTKTGTVTVRDTPPIAEAGSHVYVLASAGHLAGASNSNWVSDAVLHNPGAGDASAYLYFLRKGINGTSANGVRTSIPAGQSVKLADLVLATFGESSASGAVLVGCDQPLVVTSRTYNTATTGTFGQYIEGYPSAQAVAGTEEVRLLGLARNAVYRTNIGFANASGVQTNVSVELHRADGSLLGTKPVKVEPWAYAQENDIIAAFSQSVDNAYAIVKATQAGARYFTYASVIDGRTNDPIQVVPVGRQAQPAAATEFVPTDPTSTIGAVAGVNQWTQLKPGHLAVNSIAPHPTTPGTLFAGTPQGVWRFSGGTWTQLGLSAFNNVLHILVDHLTPTTLYAQTDLWGIQKSTDGGLTWTKLANAPSQTTALLTMHPQTPTTLYLTSEGGVYRTVDGGLTWTRVNPAGRRDVANVLAIAASSPDILFASCWEVSMCVTRSNDGGATWSPGVTFASTGRLGSIAVDPTNPSVVFAGAAKDMWNPNSGVYRSGNSGLTWTKVADTGSFYIAATILPDPRNPSLVLVAGEKGVLRSTSGGTSFAPSSTGLSHLRTVGLTAGLANEQGTFYAATGSGAFRSTDNGATWSPLNTGLPPASIGGLAIDSRSPRHLYAAGTSGGGFWSSTNDGATWTAATGSPTSAKPAIAVDPAGAGRVYAGTDGGGMMRSTDAGASWSPLNTGLTNLAVWALVVDPLNPLKLYTGCYYTGSWGGPAFFRSTDGGSSWSGVPTSQIADPLRLLIDPVTPSTLYAASGLGGGVHKSTDSGVTWQPAYTGMGQGDTTAFAIDGHSPNVLYASKWGGVWKTTDRAGTWARIETLSTWSASTIAVDPRNSWVYLVNDRLRRSKDGGATWSEIPGPPAAIHTMLVDPDDSSLYAGTSLGVFKITLVDCTYTVSPTSRSFTHTGGSGTVAVTASSSQCAWTAVSNAAWLTVTSGGSGAGTGSVGYAVAANTTTAQRTGTITIAGKTFTVTQDGKPAGPDPIYVPGAAHVAGTANTNWRTDLEIHNPGATQAGYTIALLKRDQDNPTPVEKPYTLGPGLSTRYPDALWSLFSHDGGATLRVTATQGQVMVTSRTYNDQPDGTYGQFVPGAPVSVAFVQGVQARLVELAYSTNPKQGFRTNIGLVNASSLTIAVWVDLYRGDGTKVGTRGATLGPFKSIQLNDVFSTVTTSDVPDGFALVRTTTAGGALFAYASVIDNRSGDPIFIPARVPAP